MSKRVILRTNLNKPTIDNVDVFTTMTKAIEGTGINYHTIMRNNYNFPITYKGYRFDRKIINK